MPRAFLVALTVPFLHSGAVVAQDTDAPPPGTRIDLRIHALSDLFYWVHAVASGHARAPDVAGFNEAVAAARDLDRALANPLAWGLLEGSLALVETSSELIGRFEELPERLTRGPVRDVPVREGALRLARALVPIERVFREKLWPERKARLVEAAGEIEESLRPKESEWIAFLLQSLGMPDPELRVPVHLVWDSPFPHAFSHRLPGVGGVCFVDVDDLAGSACLETIVHELTHVLDVATTGQATVLERLRSALEGAGIDARDPASRHVPHTLIFVQAAETIRRVTDPAHEDYGVTHGYYEKVPAVARVIRPAWKAHLDGELSRDEALDRIVQGFVDSRRSDAGQGEGDG